MTTFVALIRGINVAGKNKLPMAELRTLFVSLGHLDAETYIQSGNVIFSCATPLDPSVYQKAIMSRFHLEVSVMTRSVAEMRRIAREMPFPDGSEFVHVGFMSRSISTRRLTGFDADRYLPEQLVIKRDTCYFFLPNGMGRAKLTSYLDRRLKVDITVRNWNTVNAILELASHH